MSVLSKNNENIDHGSRRSALVQEILAEVFMKKFTPGQRMRVEYLAERYGMSATPVREALVELASMGIVELQPNRGAVLHPFGPRQLREIYHLRRILECEAVRGACDRIARFELLELEQELVQMLKKTRNQKWSDQTLIIDTSLHLLISERCGNERLAHEIARYHDLYLSLRDLRHNKRKQQADYTQVNDNSEHLAIVRAMLSNDVEKTAQAMASHIDSAAMALEKDLFDPLNDDSGSKVPYLVTAPNEI